MLRVKLLLTVLLAGVALSLPTAARENPPQQTVRISILQVNDVYTSMPVEKGKRGGLARLATLRQEIQRTSPHILFLLAGDTISPSVASGVFKGEQMISAWNAMGLDYCCIGNHEFDFGDEVLISRMKQSSFKWLNANVIDRRTGKPFGNGLAYDIRTVGGVKVGLFGLCTTDTKTHSKPGPDVEFLDPIETAKKVVPEMRRQGATVVIALTHLVMDEDKQLAREVPIDVIIGGHEHVILQALIGRTPIFKMGCEARDLGKIDLTVGLPSGTIQSIDWEVLPVTSDIKDDPQVAAIVGRYEKILSEEMDRTVGKTAVPLDAVSTHNRGGETNIANFIADAYREYTKADVALVNGGSIRANATIGPGPLSRRDLVSILPFENPVVKVEVPGKVLRRALEHGISKAEGADFGGFPHVSGIRFAYDLRKPVGSRIVEMTVQGQPLDEARPYAVAMSTYLLNGGDGYEMFKGAKLLVKPEEAAVEPVVLLNAVSARGEIAPEVDGRARRVDGPK